MFIINAIASSTLVTATVAAAAVTTGVVASAIIVEPIAEGIEQIIDKTTGTILEIVYNGIRYAVKKLTDSVRYEMQNGLYWLATADKETGKMYISTTVVTISIASSAMKVGLSCYTPSFTDAYNVAKNASDGLQPVHNEAHEVGYFNYYHRVNKKGVAHAFYGSPREI